MHGNSYCPSPILISVKFLLLQGVEKIELIAKIHFKGSELGNFGNP
jgi:hypothetical protein